jgi:hypothetical protein
MINEQRNKSHQRIIREEKAANVNNNLLENFWDDLDLSPAKATIESISYKLAESIIKEYEWLGTMPQGSFLQVGLFLDGVLAGVECFTNVKAGGYYTFQHEPATCLARGACVHWSPKWANSFLVSKALKFLEQYYDGEPRYVLAYSDWAAGEIGTIYQACNWTYLGHEYQREWRDSNGKRYDHKHQYTRAKLVDPEYKKTKKVNKQIVEQELKKLIDNGWYKSKTMRGTYITVIGYRGKRKKELQQKIDKLAKPYPKLHNQPATRKHRKENI